MREKGGCGWYTGAGLLRVEKNSAGSEWSPGSERERAAARERGTDSREAALYSLAARGADFLLGKLRDEAGLDDEREVRETALAEDLAVAEGTRRGTPTTWAFKGA
jgi:hypothetical protein